MRKLHIQQGRKIHWKTNLKRNMFWMGILILMVFMLFNIKEKEKGELKQFTSVSDQTNMKELSSSPQDDSKVLKLEKENYYLNMQLDLIKQKVEKGNDVQVKKIVSVLKGGLSGQEETFYKRFDEKTAKLVMSVICAESGCGQHQCGTNNFSGIMKNGKCANYSSVNEYIDAIKSQTGIYFTRMKTLEVNETNLNEVFIGNGKYCTSGCSNWISNTLHYYNLQNG